LSAQNRPLRPTVRTSRHFRMRITVAPSIKGGSVA
jgi:hypothetical protein